MKRTVFCILIFTIFSQITVLAQDGLEPKKSPEGLWGYCKGEQWVIPPKYDRAASFTEGLACVRLNGKYGFINAIGDVVIPFRFDRAYSFSEGLACVLLNWKYGFINSKGEMVIPYRFDNAFSFSEGLAPVFSNGKWGFVDQQGLCIIPYQYESVNCFSEGLAVVQYGGVWGYIDHEAKWYAAKEDYVPKFSDYAKRYVEERINKWQLKGKYEKTIDWKARVSPQNRQLKVSEYTKEAEKNYIVKMGNDIKISHRLFEYDADNEVFLVKDDNFGNLLIPVPIVDAPKFEEDFYKMKRSVRYFIEDDKLGLAELTFTNEEGKKFVYNNQASLDYFVTNVDYRFEPVEIDQSVITRMEKGEQKIGYAKLSSINKSDVDINIPTSSSVNNKTFAVIIANELYKQEESVPYARTDGESVRNYCISTLGIPEERIQFYPDATLNEMRMAMHWVKDIGEAFGDDAIILFYYAGHGVADDASRSSFLLPIDGLGRDPESGYSIDKLYSQLGALPVESVIVMLDACFSGAKRDGDMLVASRGVAIKPKSSTPSGNMIVISATTGDETAALYPQKGHGLFTYFLLKKLQESKGDCTLGELAEFVSKKVNQESVVANKRPQSPTVLCSPSMTGKWSEIKFK